MRSNKNTLLIASQLAVKTQVKAGDGAQSGGTNHNETLQVATRVLAGGGQNGMGGTNHNETLYLKSQVKAGGTTFQHNESLKLASQVKAGKVWPQHNEAIRA
jgi:hypothetical protein